MKRKLLLILLIICCFLLINSNTNEINSKTQTKTDLNSNEDKVDVKSDDSMDENVIKLSAKYSKTQELNEPTDSEDIIAEEVETNDVLTEEELVEESPEEPIVEKELSEKERLSISLYESAISLLNSSRSDRSKAYDAIIESAKLDYEPAIEWVAKEHLFGDHLNIDLNIAKQYFSRLSLKGNANSQLVCLKIFNQ